MGFGPLGEVGAEYGGERDKVAEAMVGSGRRLTALGGDIVVVWCLVAKTEVRLTLRGRKWYTYSSSVYLFHGGSLEQESERHVSSYFIVFDTIMVLNVHCFSQLGRICLDILKDKWSPALQIRTVLLSIQALLSAPNPDDPLSENIAKHWKSNEAEAVETAKEWTRLYASDA
ncbi:hypothetical protein LR48_Vigan08g037300 [Vigna angularis]|uniref:UBC core domain-containing protein n=1 Tax=Phaseolus angularis TaxID=3914 RepID=A0A0L9V3L1_PHAAN|nr:hypothetical protein LR48_Vigan08g037300 [Vigna angularis]